MENIHKKLKKLLNDSKIIDIVIFGSSVKGKIRPADMDIALIVKDKENVSKIKKEINKITKKSDIQVLTINNIYDALWQVILTEGFSIKKNKYFFEMNKIKPVILFKYSLKKLNPVEKVQFSRGLNNFIKDGSKRLTRTVMLVPVNNKNSFEDFLDNWKIKYDSLQYGLLPVLRKGEI